MFNTWEKIQIKFPPVTNTAINLMIEFPKIKQLTECLTWKFLKEFRESFGEISI